MLKQPLDAAGLRGTVVNVGSVLDRSPSPEHFGTLAYAASKGAVRAMTLAAAARYAPDRIRFNLLVPGLIDTPMAARAVERRRLRPYLAAKQPIAGGPGTATDVAEAALYLCEPASRFVTGRRAGRRRRLVCLGRNAIRKDEAPTEPSTTHERSTATFFPSTWPPSGRRSTRSRRRSCRRFARRPIGSRARS